MKSSTFEQKPFEKPKLVPKSQPTEPEVSKLKQLQESAFEPHKQSAQPATEQGKENPVVEVPGFFQAIGVISGVVKISDDQTTIAIENKEFPIFYARRNRIAFDALKKEVERTGDTQTLVVYPKIIHFPDRDKPHLISFQLVGFAGGTENESSATKELTPLEFKLSGLWQFIPVSRTPCISVFKNYSPERKEFVKATDNLALKVKFMKASHIPLFWKDALVPPFRFNPKLDSNLQGKPFFVSVKAKFNPQRGIFEFDSITSMPQEKPPRFLKVSKADKAEALKAQMASRKAQRADAAQPNLGSSAGRNTLILPKPRKV